jgi:hypothetical protein
VRLQKAPYDVREPARWGRGVLFVALLVVPLAIYQWPWKFLPLRWQYPGAIHRGERIVQTIEGFRAAAGRLPSPQELGNALPVEDWPCSECYDPRGTSYSLMVDAGFHYSISYDPGTREFRRSP